MKIWHAVLLLLLFVCISLANAQEIVTDAYEVTWSPDGRWIAVTTTQGLWLFDAENLQAEPVIYFEEDSIGTVEFDTTGAYLAVAQGFTTGPDDEDYFVRILELETGEVIHEFYPESYDEFGGGVIYDMHYSRDGQYLLVANMGMLSIYDATGSERIKLVFMNTDDTGMSNSAPQYWITSISEIGVSGRIAVTNWDKELTIISLNDEGSLIQHGVYVLPADFVFSADYFEDRDFLILTGDGVFIFDIADESMELAVQPSADESSSGYALAPDNQTLAIGIEGYWQLYDVESREMILEVPLAADGDDIPRIFSLSFNPDGSRLVTLQTGGLLKIWDTVTGELVQNLWEFDRAFSPKWG